ncbi:class I SAM-dependent methyltransferase [Acuticoccus sp. 2012]|uniref:Class I SAM-dependent methyltransferase n=1 Tax=Acuticoccus mangrovi TaxID=2796142 RepID=A0A934MGC7_9HYPH|nr:class I SAM-dependent methyltransferase [Acuticoccus mangrovi]
MARFFRTGYRSDLAESWLPALDGVVARLTYGARVADIGCGHGHSTIMMAEAFAGSSFVGYDFHHGSIKAATQHAQRHGVADRVTFEVAMAKGYGGRGFDLITFFDTLHDLGDPVGTVRQARRALDDDGVLMLVEPQRRRPAGRQSHPRRPALQ